jgi:hypothetical protein
VLLVDGDHLHAWRDGYHASGQMTDETGCQPRTETEVGVEVASPGLAS